MCVFLSWLVYINTRSQKPVKIKIRRHAGAASLNDKQAQLQEDLWLRVITEKLPLDGQFVLMS
jgi:hypothetical protein